MSLAQLLPTALKVALRSARGDARSVARALREQRFKGGRRTSGSSARVPASRSSQPRRTTAPEADVAGSVEFTESGVRVELGPDQSILEAGLRNGVDLMFSCTLGGCGACILKVVEGEVTYEDRHAICLTDEEIDEGYCLACVGRPRGHVVLEA